MAVPTPAPGGLRGPIALPLAPATPAAASAAEAPPVVASDAEAPPAAASAAEAPPTAASATDAPPAAASVAEAPRAATSARVLGGATAGVIELFGFHPVDTVAKRLMAHDAVVRTPGMPLAAAMSGYSRVVLRDAHSNPSLFARYASLFPGLSFAAGYKILQRVYKFGGQPVANDFFAEKFGRQAEAAVGGDPVKAKMLLHAVSGAAIGVGEVVLLPLDVLKIKSQNNPESLRGRGLVQILRQEKLLGLYRGAGWTAARNAPGSFSLFGASALVKGRVFGLENFNDATLMQNFAASAAGGIASITVASPLDVVKTRLQMRDFGSQETGGQILSEMMRKEGPSALFKGLVPKLFVVGPKLIFSFTIAQHTIALFDDMLRRRSVQADQGAGSAGGGGKSS